MRVEVHDVLGGVGGDAVGLLDGRHARGPIVIPESSVPRDDAIRARFKVYTIGVLLAAVGWDG